MAEKYLLFIIEECPYCDMARDLLKDKEFVIVDVSNDLMVRQQVKRAFDWNTFPIILQKENSDLRLIGGFTDLE